MCFARFTGATRAEVLEEATLMKHNLRTIAILASLTLAAMASALEPAAKSAILFIGDGMGPAHITAARLYAGGSDGHLAMESMPFTGYCRTHSSSDYVTDSGAAGTALSCGVKTANGLICMSDPSIDPSGKSRSLQTITDLMLAAGKSVGLVTTASIVNATPAVFYAHSDDRWDEIRIADQIATSGLTLLLGGGRRSFHPETWMDPEYDLPGMQPDGRDLEAEMTGHGWTFVNSRQDLAQIDPATAGLKLIGTFQYTTMNYEFNRPNDVLGEPSLAEMTSFAIDVLSRDPDGYFLMVEGGLVDQASHANDARNAIGDVLALDAAVRVAQETVDASTLVVVTADHETGGMALNGYAPRRWVRGPALLSNVDIGTGPRGLISWGSGPGAESPEAVDESNPYFPFRAAYAGSIATHSAVDVPLMAMGPGAMNFSGYRENIEIPLLITQQMGLAYDSPVNKENHDAYEAQKSATRVLPYP